MNKINSTLGNIAATIEEAYNNGRVVSSDEKLTYWDFLQMIYLQYGDIAGIQYYNERRAGNQNYYFSKGITKKIVQAKPNPIDNVPNICLDDYALLPYMAGILSLYPKVKQGKRDPEDEYTKMPAGAESIYSNAKRLDDLGLRFFVVKGNKLELWGNDEDTDFVVEYIPLSEDTEVPPQIGWIMVKETLKIVLPYKQTYADTHEDMDPNITTFKQRLDQPQDIS